MASKQRNWRQVARLEPRGKGQRFFAEFDPDIMESGKPVSEVALRNVHVYIVDNSGADPDRTDDGPLRLDRSRPLRLQREDYAGGHSALYVRVPVVAERSGGEFFCGCTPREAVWLVNNTGMRIEVEEEALRDIGPLVDLRASASVGDHDIVSSQKGGA